MATFVIVHGAFGGGWEWTPVAGLLREMGHEVFTPTLTGMGDRSHLGPEVGLGTHVADVVSVLQFEGLRDVVLCGASYGGMAITGAADRAPARIRMLVYIDALAPRDGQAGLDLLPAEFAESARALADARGHGWVPVPAAALPPTGIIDERRRDAYVSRLRPQPLATFTEPLHLAGAADCLPRVFVRCVMRSFKGVDPIELMAARARAEAWAYREIEAPHDPHLFDPAMTARVLHSLVDGAQ